MLLRDPIRRVGLIFLIVALMTTAVMVLVAWMLGFSQAGVACLAGGFSGIWWWRFTAWQMRDSLTRGSAERDSVFRSWKWIRWLCIAVAVVFGLFAILMWIAMVPKGMHGVPLSGALVGMFVFSSVIGALCTQPWRKPRAVFGMLAMMCASVFLLMWTGAARDRAWYDTKGRPVSNWLLAQSVIDEEMNRARRLFGYALSSRDQIRTVTADVELAKSELELADYLAADRVIDRAIRWAETRNDIDQSVSVEMWLVRGKVRFLLEDRERAQDDLQNAIQIARQQGASARRVLIDALSERAQVRMADNDWRGAELDLSEAISHGSVDTPSVRIEFLTRRSRARIHLLDLTRALDDANGAIRLAETSAGIDPSLLTDAIQLLSRVLLELGDSAAAVDAASRALSVIDGNSANAEHRRASSLVHRARAYILDGNYGDAEQDLALAINTYEAFGSQHTFSMADALSRRAVAWTGLDKLDAALDDISRAINVGLDDCDACRERVAQWRGLRARILHEMGRPAEARVDIHHVVDWLESHDPENSALDNLRAMRDEIESAILDK
jgi:tetratricopeptide (TPR) repeat protein